MVGLDTLMRDNLCCLFYKYSPLCLDVYADAIVDITPQLITLNQRSKSDKYHKNKHPSAQILIYIYSFVFVPKSRSPVPKVTLGTGFQSVKSTFVFRMKR
jgi:hypothetical protein